MIEVSFIKLKVANDSLGLLGEVSLVHIVFRNLIRNNAFRNFLFGIVVLNVVVQHLLVTQGDRSMQYLRDMAVLTQ